MELTKEIPQAQQQGYHYQHRLHTENARTPHITKTAQNVKPIRSGIIALLFPPHLTTARALVEAPNTATPANILENKA